jgi:hypothetical protein
VRDAGTSPREHRDGRPHPTGMRSPHDLLRRCVGDVAVVVLTISLLTGATAPRAEDDGRRGRPPTSVEEEEPAPAPDGPEDGVPEPDPPPPPAEATSSEDGSSTVEPRGLPATVLTVLVVAVAAVAALGGWAIGRRGGARTERPAAGAVSVSGGDAAAQATHVAQQGAPDPAVADLVDGLIAVYDLATDDGQRTRVRETLRRVAVEPIEPEPLVTFDPTLHRALGVELAGDPGDDGRIARTDRPGWVRDGQLLRPPEVTVYRSRHEVAPT